MMFRTMTFASHFTMVKVHMWGSFVKCGDGLAYFLILGPFFQGCPYFGAFALQIIIKIMRFLLSILRLGYIIVIYKLMSGE
jgi:hypothetical protein